MQRHLRVTVLDDKRESLQAWQDRLRDPSLTVLLFLQVFLMFVALPLDATGVPIAEPVAWLLLLVVLTLVVMLSHRGVAHRPIRRAPVAHWYSGPAAAPFFYFIMLCLLMLALWSCGRRGSVVQAQRQIHRV